MDKKVRKFSIHDEIHTALEYGKFYLKKTHEESDGVTVDPKAMSDKEIEEWAIEFLEERILEDDEVYEIK